jgi:hypothetical protein
MVIFGGRVLGRADADARREIIERRRTPAEIEQVERGCRAVAGEAVFRQVVAGVDAPQAGVRVVLVVEDAIGEIDD